MRFKTSNAEAIAWVVMATALFSLIFASGKFAGESASVFQLNFLRMTGGLLTLFILVMVNGGGFRQYRSRRPWAHFARTVFGVVGALSIIQASADMPIVDATALSLLYVVFVIILGVVIFRERIGLRQGGGILLCVFGAIGIMASRGAFLTFDPAYLMPAGLAILGAVLFALEGILIKILAEAEKPLAVMLYVNTFGVLLLALPAIATWNALPWGEYLAYALLGPLGTLAQYCVIRGYRMADISVVGPVDYSWLIFASLIGYVAFSEVPSLGVIAGSVLIAAGGIVLATVKPAREKQPVIEFQ
ncbi:MAG: hypothetical protein RLZZ444_1586 [Pseudomonadota bacterium]|jgi:drug/metabolite transporter (DMT)-like permease